MENLTKIGQGRYSTVHAGIYFQGGCQESIAAFKEVRLSLSNSPVAQSALKAVLREILALKAIGPHRNIVRLDGYSVMRASIFLQLEYCDWDIDKLLIHCDLNIPECVVADMAHQLFSGLMAIHSSGICHRDIKPSNILLCSSSGLLKVADFGLARSIVALEGCSRENLATREVCTRWYKAIEILLGNEHSPAMDVWSAGLVVAEMLNHCPLFPGISDINQIYLIFSALGYPTLEDWPEFGNLPDSHKLPFSGEPGNFFPSWDELVPRGGLRFGKLLGGALRLNPRSRLTCAKILENLEILYCPCLVSDWLRTI